jgi:hypothetical protein
MIATSFKAARSVSPIVSNRFNSRTAAITCVESVRCLPPAFTNSAAINLSIILGYWEQKDETVRQGPITGELADIYGCFCKIPNKAQRRAE